LAWINGLITSCDYFISIISSFETYHPDHVTQN